jgi:hypothetical protein
MGDCVRDRLRQVVKDATAFFNADDDGRKVVIHQAVKVKFDADKSNMMSAASLATSEPMMPIATPMSAFLSAGESFTPS